MWLGVRNCLGCVFFSSRRRHTRYWRDWSSDVCSSDLPAFREAIDLMLEPYKDEQIDVVVGMESRGFIFSAPMAYQLNAGLVPVRKLGKRSEERRVGKECRSRWSPYH